MISRPLIHITGPLGAGKTLLVEHVLRSTYRDLAVARCIGDDSLKEPRESQSKSHAELNRYRKAGADGPTEYRFPFREVADWRGSRTAITAVIANLADADDLGTGKAIARIKRSLHKRE